jgi:hypothetical protein
MLARTLLVMPCALATLGAAACEDDCCLVPPDRGLPELVTADLRRADARAVDLPPSDLAPPSCPSDKLLVLEDKEFADGSWSYAKHASSTGGSFVVSNKNAAGAPLGHQATELTLDAAGQLWVSHFYTIRLKPKDRPLKSLRATLLARVTSPGGAVGVSPLCVQGPKSFRAGHTEVTATQGAVTVGGGFVPVSAGDALELGAGGEEIGVGYLTTLDAVGTRRVEIDNWRLEVCYP